MLQKRGTMKRLIKGSAAVILALFFLGVSLGVNIPGAHAQARLCSGNDRAYSVVGGDTLSGIGARFGASWTILASHNHIANPGLIYVNQIVCIPGSGPMRTGSVNMYHAPIRSQSIKTGNSEFFTNIYLGNQFPWPQCTWWANERYHQMHGIYVPWRTNSNAWQWTARAHDFHWHVSTTPAVGWIMNLQPWVQGAYGLGHVGMVEKVLGGGYFVASNTNWGYNPTVVTYVTFHAGSGVTFIHQ